LLKRREKRVAKCLSLERGGKKTPWQLKEKEKKLAEKASGKGGGSQILEMFSQQPKGGKPD